MSSDKKNGRRKAAGRTLRRIAALVLLTTLFAGLVERSLSDIWNKMISEGTSAQVAIDEQTIPINREIKKKMQELGFMDENGKLLQSYVIRDVDWIEEQIKNARGQ